MPISHSSTISMERMLLLYAILIQKSINVGKIILKEIHDCAKKKAGREHEEPTEPDTEESTDGTETEANQSQTLKRKNLIRNQTFLSQSSQMLSFRHRRKILTMQAEMNLKKTREKS
ncbi:hypothetical protein Gotur_034341 [Gossypium turneri]